MTRDDWLTTGIGAATSDAITLLGRDLCDELMGHISFADLAFLLATRRDPSPDESRFFNAVLVALTDHGLTPTVLAARLTYTGAPESFQGAVAAGLLGAGSVFLGPTEDTARFLGDIVAIADSGSEHQLREAARVAVVRCLESGRRVPGLGHPIHKERDPRVERLYTLSEELSVGRVHMQILRMLPDLMEEIDGRRLPINGAGAAGAALADLGIGAEIARGFALLARTAGLIAHLAEEMRSPIGLSLVEDIQERVRYDPPA